MPGRDIASDIIDQELLKGLTMSESFQTSPSFILLALLTGLLYFANGLRARSRVQKLSQATQADILSILLGLIACLGHGFE